MTTTRTPRLNRLRDDIGEINPPYQGAVFSQPNLDGGQDYFDGDGVYLRSDEPPGKKKIAQRTESDFFKADAASIDAGKDYSNRRPLEDPNPPAPDEAFLARIPGTAMMTIKHNIYRELRGNGVNVDNNGQPTSAKELKELIAADLSKSASPTNARPVTTTTEDRPSRSKTKADDEAKDDTAETQAQDEDDPEEAERKRQEGIRKANPYMGVDPAKAMKAYLIDELPKQDDDGNDIRPPNFAELNGWAGSLWNKKFTGRPELIAHAVEAGFVKAEEVKATGK